MELVVLIALDCDDAFETPGENLEPVADLEHSDWNAVERHRARV